MKTGRRASIPSKVFDDVRRWHREGIGCIRIAKLLEDLGVYTGKSSVDRLIHGKPPYESVPTDDGIMTRAEILAELPARRH